MWTAPPMQGACDEKTLIWCESGRVSGLLARGTAAGPDGFRDPHPNGLVTSKAATLRGFCESSVRPISIFLPCLPLHLHVARVSEAPRGTTTTPPPRLPRSTRHHQPGNPHAPAWRWATAGYALSPRLQIRALDLSSRHRPRRHRDALPAAARRLPDRRRKRSNAFGNPTRPIHRRLGNLAHLSIPKTPEAPRHAHRTALAGVTATDGTESRNRKGLPGRSTYYHHQTNSPEWSSAATAD